MPEWSNLAKVIYRGKYARALNEERTEVETWPQTYERAIAGNVRGFEVTDQEIQRLKYFLSNRKAGPAGRGWWFSGSPMHEKLGGGSLVNCWGVTADHWENFVEAQNLLMLGGGVGMSVEHRFVSKLPRAKKDVQIVHRPTKDADFIVPDSREGWNELTRRVLVAHFVTGKSFSYSTVCIRGAGEPIRGFGGVASGPLPLIDFVAKVSKLLSERGGKHIRPIDAADIMCSIGEMVKNGNVRRSAINIMCDPWDKEILKAKRWNLGIPIPSQRSMANFSVICDDVDDLHPQYWATYESGEPFGIVNRTNIQMYGRMGEKIKDTAILVNPCGEACLDPFEPCNLTELALPHLESEMEFLEAAMLMHRWGKRITCEDYHSEAINRIVKKNRRIGTGITGCLQSGLFNAEILDRVYAAIQEENVRYSQELNIRPSIRTTVIKPSGTVSKMFDIPGEGLHPGYSRYYIQRIRLPAVDPVIPFLRQAGHHIEPELRLDGTSDAKDLVVDFYLHCPPELPTVDEGFDTWKQLDSLLFAQRHWSDQAVSITAYYNKEDIPRIKAWLRENLQNIKGVSFLPYFDHGFKQAPKEAITKEEYEAKMAKIRPLEDISAIGKVEDFEGTECDGNTCPSR